MKARTLLLLASSCFAPAVLAQREFSRVQINVVPVAKNDTTRK